MSKHWPSPVMKGNSFLHVICAFASHVISAIASGELPAVLPPLHCWPLPGLAHTSIQIRGKGFLALRVGYDNRSTAVSGTARFTGIVSLSLRLV